MSGTKRLTFEFLANPMAFGSMLRIGRFDDDGHGEVAEPITFKEYTPYVTQASTALDVSDEDMQRFMDALWKSGKRPSRYLDEVGVELDLTRRHLWDLRKILFDEDH